MEGWCIGGLVSLVVFAPSSVYNALHHARSASTKLLISDPKKTIGPCNATGRKLCRTATADTPVFKNALLARGVWTATPKQNQLITNALKTGTAPGSFSRVDVVREAEWAEGLELA